jgi:hypothetical protein
VYFDLQALLEETVFDLFRLQTKSQDFPGNRQLNAIQEFVIVAVSPNGKTLDMLVHHVHGFLHSLTGVLCDYSHPPDVGDIGCGQNTKREKSKGDHRKTFAHSFHVELLLNCV